MIYDKEYQEHLDEFDEDKFTDEKIKALKDYKQFILAHNLYKRSEEAKKKKEMLEAYKLEGLVDPDIMDYLYVVVGILTFVVVFVLVDLNCCLNTKPWKTDPYYLRISEKLIKEQANKNAVEKKLKRT